MNEPDNQTGWVDRYGGTWVRDDAHPGMYGNWHPITDGPGFEQSAQNNVGQGRPWDWMTEYGPFTPADYERTRRALDLVKEAHR